MDSFVISIVAGVWILAVWDNLQNWGESIKRMLANPREHHLLFKRKAGGQTLMGWMKELTHPYIREQEEIQKIFKSWENYLSDKDPKRKHLKKLKNLAEALGPMGVKEETRQLVKDMVSEMFKLYPVLNSYQKQAYLPNLLKKMRWIIWQMKYLEKVMRCSFFVGMLAILVFTIINSI